MTTAFLFTGQGAQRPGMADGWSRHPLGADVLEEAGAFLECDLAEACRDPRALARTELAQPALLACGVAAARVLADRGVRPDAVAGHSLGEFAALVAAGVLEFGEALAVVSARAAAMAGAADAEPGAMLAVLGPDAQRLAAEAVGADLVVANDNGPQQVVLSGTVAAVDRAETLVREGGGKAKRLKVAGAFHSPLMEPAARAVEAALDACTLKTPEPWVIPNVTAEPTRDPAVLDGLLRRHLLAPVLWRGTVDALAGLGATRVVECGPAAVLTGLTRPALPDAAFHLASTPDRALSVTEARLSAA